MIPTMPELRADVGKSLNAFQIDAAIEKKLPGFGCEVVADRADQAGPRKYGSGHRCKQAGTTQNAIDASRRQFNGVEADGPGNQKRHREASKEVVKRSSQKNEKRSLAAKKHKSRKKNKLRVDHLLQIWFYFVLLVPLCG
jgi:hypothetical protein